MKKEYVEGPQALENFEQAMKTIFKAPKVVIERAKKKQKKASSLRKAKRADKD
jgi:hypothetical protein